MSPISQPVPIGSGKPPRSSTSYTPCIDDIEKLSKLRLLPGIAIKKFIAAQNGQTSDMAEVDITDYIVPSDLLDEIDGIPLEHREIAMLQLQHSADSRPDDFTVLNDLACVYAVLGRYHEARDSLTQAKQVAEQVWGTVKTAEVALQATDAVEHVLQALNQVEKKLQTVEAAKQTLQALQAVEQSLVVDLVVRVLQEAEYVLQGSLVVEQAALAVEQVVQVVQEAEYTLHTSLAVERAALAVDRVLLAVQEAKDAVARILPNTFGKIMSDNLHILKQIINAQSDQRLWGTIGVP